MKRAPTIIAIALLAMSTVVIRAQDYPNHFLKLVHGFPSGGNVDVLARLMAEEMVKGFGQPIVVESRPGAVGTLAAEYVARSAPDGYTLLFLPSAHTVTAAIYKSVKYDPVDDFAWISTVSFYPFVLCVRQDSKWQSLQALLQEAKSKPDGLSYGSTGMGSIHHMTIELLSRASHTRFVNVSYRGEGQVLLGILSGDIDFAVTTVTVAAPQIRSGAVRALGVTGKTRWRDLPDIPTFEEAGLPGFEVISWSGFAAPAGTAQPIIERIHAEVQRSISVASVRERLEALGGDVRAAEPEEMRALVARQVALWAKLARDANIQAQ